ncbi:peptidoglycan-binding protein [Candidatus Peregrinibacteria bacterium]|nr:peptidoglycan-binding protein [Candidatus Peregrinibacteria bacterium]
MGNPNKYAYYCKSQNSAANASDLLTVSSSDTPSSVIQRFRSNFAIFVTKSYLSGFPMYIRRIAWMSIFMFLAYFGGQEILLHASYNILNKNRAFAQTIIAQSENDTKEDSSSGVEGEHGLTNTENIVTFPYKKVYIISAYYSPLLNQESYVTGTYEGDIRLNGDGVLSADNTYVYPGMIAAPSSIPFDTKIEIPGLGIGAVHDRGGAILSKDESGDFHDRLDVWMGFGDDGLSSALDWGRRTLEVTIYGLDDSVEENFHLDTISSGLGIGSEGTAVSELQSNLQSLGYSVKVSGLFDESTKNAVLQFQQDRSILKFESELGAGYFGPTTHVVMERALHEKRFDIPSLSDEKNIDESQNTGEQSTLSENTNFIKNSDVPKITDKAEADLFALYPDLFEDAVGFDGAISLGDSGEKVRLLQEELRKLGYLRIEPTGYFGPTTEHAVSKFQQALGIIQAETDRGAGTIGPKTREVINTLLGERRKSKRSIALKRSERTNRFLVQNDLSFGDSGSEVGNLQIMLKKLGFFQLEPTQYYGQETKNAVIQFQLANAIVIASDDIGAGRVGPKTRDTLKKFAENDYVAYSQ